MKPVRVSIITPCRNARELIGETIDSVLRQRAVTSGRVELQYLVCDGASTDGTAEAVRETGSGLVELVSERDLGMYDALAKGLRRATGDIVAYLNAGDYYHPNALDVVADVFARERLSWITGYNTIYNEQGAVTNASLPYRYRPSLFECGAYGRWLPFVQQESTFWRRSLMDGLDFEALASLRFAGDAFLWAAFARRSPLHVVQAMLGGFRFHRGQLSENRDAYLSEMRSFAKAPGPVDLATIAFDRLAWYLPPRAKKALNASEMLVYEHGTGQWR